jgi:hypothetical protein
MFGIQHAANHPLMHPNIGAVDITPFVGGNPANKIPFQNQTVANKTTRRIPQDLIGQASPPPGGGPNTNANAVQMDAVFWIETVVYDVQVPPLPAGTPPVVLSPVQTNVPVVPSFVAAIPFVPGKGFAGGVVKVATTQIQYSQKVVLDFNGLTWPHVSVASLVPSAPIPIPSNLLPLT